MLDVIGRWTRHTKQGNVPCVTGTIVSVPAGATLASGGKGKGKGKGDTLAAVAATSTHVKS